MKRIGDTYAYIFDWIVECVGVCVVAILYSEWNSIYLMDTVQFCTLPSLQIII